ncbi:MAG: EcsC family protein [Bdellovibrionaceae bacterium]|nr:EcsC family protein [Pseudobdellovibrionaceae bacterium]
MDKKTDPKLTNKEVRFIQNAAKFLENPGFLIQTANAIGKPLELVQKRLPAKIRDKISVVTQQALTKAMDISISTIKSKPDKISWDQLTKKSHLHSAATAVTGAVSGFFGPLTLAIELPMTTGIMFRSIATIAQSFGEDLTDPETRLQCLQVFAMGSSVTEKDDEMNSAYFAHRMAFNSMIKNASAFLAKHSAKEALLAIEKGTAPLLVRLLGSIAARFEIVVAEKILAESVPILGAIGGAAINTAFTDYFNRTAYFHFGLRYLEKKHGAKEIESIYFEAMKK